MAVAEENFSGDTAGFAGALRRVWRKVLTARLEQRGRTRNLQMVEALSLGGRRHVLLISCAGEQFLVGTGADAVNAIVRVGQEPSPASWQGDAS